MSSSNASPSTSNRVAAALKAAALIAVVTFVILATESPRLYMGATSDGAGTDGVAAMSITGTTSESATSDYFPGRFPAPAGEPEAQPPTF